jgi:hypothetical protein
MIAVIFVFYAGIAFAYPSQGTQDQTTGTSFQMPSFNFNWVGNTWNTLSASLRGFINGIGSSFDGNSSMNAIGKTVSNISIGNTNQSTVWGVYQNFDNWLYGVAGFRISGVFNAVLSVATWLLSLAKDIVNWLLSFIH